MKKDLLCVGLFLLSPLYAYAQTPSLSIESELKRLDVLTADPDVKLVVVGAMADELKVHRNHLILLRRETGQSYGQIFVSGLRDRGINDAEILRKLRALDEEISRRLGHSRIDSSASPRPVLFVSTGASHNSTATLYSLVPEAGIASSRISLVVGIPYYRTLEQDLPVSGIGDVYVAGFLRGRAGSLDLGSGVTLGVPTGDRNKGLGAGQITVDATGTVARRFEFVRPWVSAGFTNSVFNNVGYQRPYVTDGNAAHFSGGVDFSLRRKLTFGAGGFALRAIGSQTVYSQTTRADSQSGSAGQTAAGQMPGGHMPGGTGAGMPAGSGMPFYERAQHTVVSANELQDHGMAAWASVLLHRGFSLNFALARSVPFRLTTARAGLGVDVARLFFR